MRKKTQSSAFECCTACSCKCVTYRKLGFDFVLQVCNNPDYLEQLTGLDILRKQTEGVDCEWDDEDERGRRGRGRRAEHRARIDP